MTKSTEYQHDERQATETITMKSSMYKYTYTDEVRVLFKAVNGEHA